MQAQAYPPPYRGQRDDIPLAALEPPYAQYVTNFNLDDGILKFRKGDSAYTSSVSGHPILDLAQYGVSSNLPLVISVYENGGSFYFRDVINNSALNNFAAVYDNTDISHVYFNNYLFFFGGGLNQNVRYYNGSAWGTAGYTWPVGSVPYGGTVHKNRGYYIEYLTTKYVYTEINAITGPTNEVDLAQVVSQKSNLFGIRSISLSEGIQQENVLAFVMDTGEVLVYSGSFPNSSDWGLIGRFFIGKPVGYHPFIDARGDSYVMTQNGLVSLRDLFAKGATIATDESLTSSIPNRWKQAIIKNIPYNQYYTNTIPRGVWDSAHQRIIVFLPYYVDKDGNVDTSKSMRFIYSLKTQSWVEHVAAAVSRCALAINYPSASLEGGFAIFGSNNNYVFVMEGATGYADTNTSGSSVGYDFQMRTSPLYTERFGVNTTTGVELLSTTDAYSKIDYKLISNFGQFVTSTQKLPDQGSGVQNPFIDIGIQANYLQLDISGNTGTALTTGFEMYAINLWSVKGGVR